MSIEKMLYAHWSNSPELISVLGLTHVFMGPLSIPNKPYITMISGETNSIVAVNSENAIRETSFNINVHASTCEAGNCFANSISRHFDKLRLHDNEFGTQIIKFVKSSALFKDENHWIFSLGFLAIG